MKTGEWHTFSSDQNAVDYSARPRNICNISDQIKVLGGWVNYNLLGLMKTTSSFYLGELNID